MLLCAVCYCTRCAVVCCAVVCCVLSAMCCCVLCAVFCVLYAVCFVLWTVCCVAVCCTLQTTVFYSVPRLLSICLCICLFPGEAQQKRVQHHISTAAHLQCVVLYHGSTLAVLLCLLCCCTRCADGAVFSELLML